MQDLPVGLPRLVGPMPCPGLKAARWTRFLLNWAAFCPVLHQRWTCSYRTEQSLGEAISQALSLGLIKSRDELFITSKLWCTDAHPDRVLPAIHNTFK
ncbi:non-functional NADPH-dependent codeinone reductase 2-like isoform X2 [Prunus yedoensis var. nudiflora]|uniref:Non-functional NADPH-dependent codeinone reductase 2-like isoform X2 n=1 Tax=Prunus yedoensis var. nudiflora TaxID=2094558 RepID=A0A314Z1B9_PRUYE|nr:non-functional NADPH-dependent codeinone reductase 2-like isoform X2 [Prunus yedoensis var. nudiflora]